MPVTSTKVSGHKECTIYFRSFKWYIKTNRQ